MTEELTIDCPELSARSGNFISARSCKIYRELNDCPKSCSQHPRFSPIVTTMPQAATSPEIMPEPDTGHPGEPKKDKRGRYKKKLFCYCPDLEKPVYTVTCNRRVALNLCVIPCESSIRKHKAPGIINYSNLRDVIEKYPSLLEHLRQEATKELRDIESQLVWELLKHSL